MKDYLIGLLAASMIAALVGLLTPDGERGGIGKHVKLLTALFLVCVLIAPIGSAIEGLKKLFEGGIDLPGMEETPDQSYQEELSGALENASTAYFTQMLTQVLENQFQIPAGELRCAVSWESVGEALKPTRVTVVLSGSAIWKDPRAIEDFVEELLGCNCVSAIE